MAQHGLTYGFLLADYGLMSVWVINGIKYGLLWLNVVNVWVIAGLKWVNVWVMNGLINLNMA